MREVAAVGEDHVEALDHVLDLPVAPRQLARRPARQPPADGGQGDGLGPVAEGEAVGAAQLVLQDVAERAGPHVEDQRGGVDVDDAAQRGEVEDDPAVQRDRRPADTAAAAGRGDGDLGLVAQGEHGPHLVGVGRAGDGGGQPGDLALGGPRHGEGPPVPAGLGQRRRLDRDLAARGRQPLEEGVVHLDAGGRQPGPGPGTAAGQRDRRGGRPGTDRGQRRGRGHAPDPCRCADRRAARATRAGGRAGRRPGP